MKNLETLATSVKYKVIYADPPWYFRSYSSKGEGRNATQHYNCMSISDICKLPIQNLADEDCALLMWCVDPMLPEAFKVIEAWGFQYKTVGFTWAKQNKKDIGMFTGMGYWTRANPEMCLLATRGKPQRKSKSVKQLVMSPRREHSRKPDEIYNYIEDLLDGPYVELFARTKREGWESWGNQINKF